MVGYTKPNKGRKTEGDRLTGERERDKITFIDLYLKERTIFSIWERKKAECSINCLFLG